MENKNDFNFYGQYQQIYKEIMRFKTRGINKKNKFNLKKITIDFEGEKENIVFNFDNGEFIKIKDTRIIFGLATIKDCDDYFSKLKLSFTNNHANLILLRYGESKDLGTDNHARIYFEDLENLEFNLTGYYAIFAELDKLILDSNFEISKGIISVLKEIEEEEDLEALRKMKEKRDELQRKIELEATLYELKESQYKKNKKLLSDYINFLKKENLTKEINLIYHYGQSLGLTTGYPHYQANYGSRSTKTSKKLCRDKIKNLIIENAKQKGFDLSFIDKTLIDLILSKADYSNLVNIMGFTYAKDFLDTLIGDYESTLNLKNQDFKEIFEIESVKEFFKNHFFEYNFKTSMVGEQHNQHWVVESFEIIEKIKKGV